MLIKKEDVELIERFESTDHGYYIWSCIVHMPNGSEKRGFIEHHDMASELILDTFEEENGPTTFDTNN